MMENDTNTEYFDGGYFIRDKKQIKCFENGKRGLKLVTQAQQNKLMMQAKGNNQHKKQPTKMFESDSDGSENSIATEEEQPKPVQRAKRKVQNKPQIKYVNPQLDFEELISLRTENKYIKQQHADMVKQNEKYKNKLKALKQPKPKQQPKQIEQEEEQEEEEQQPQQQPQYNYYDVY
ncbi:MAG: hypothetical protein EZS28_024404 [Streblomastix strix]|uniref:Uncharacterized protein n=1 Tax=Streblomastix strix TaxID=222440 RepID=A0A5J4VC12_9EUKA|nr:MAG: hypothetical protein EZS28_024404 [Streblomastix strix]